MNMRYRQIKSKIVVKIVNVSTALALCFGAVTPAIAQATTGQAGCQATTVEKHLFLPIVTNSVNQVAAANAWVPSTIPRKLQYQIGKQYTYLYDYSIETKSAARDTQGVKDEGGQTTIIHAFADVTIREQAADGSFAGQVLLRDSFLCTTNSSGAETVVNDPELLAALQQPLRFNQTPAGTITNVAFPANAPLMAVNLQKGIINALQLSLQEGANTYQADENGAQGSYRVNYTLEDKADGLHITKTFNQASFTNLISAGDENKQLQLQNRIDMVLDSEKGVLSSIKINEGMLSSNESQNPLSNNSPDIDGMAVWSAVNSQGSLTLRNVTDAPAVTAAQAAIVYTEGGLGAQLLDNHLNGPSIDLATVDLAAELSALEQDPKNPGLVQRLINLVAADPERAVLDQIRTHLQQNAANADITAAYIDVLAAIGTPAAQEILNGVLGNASVQAAQPAAPFSDAAQEHALIGMVLLASPTMTTVNTLTEISNDVASPLQAEATTVLGAVAHALADEDEPLADTISAELVAKLQTASDPDAVELYLSALGNAGDPATLATLQSYITDTLTLGEGVMTDTVSIQIAALTALRKIPGDEVEAMLLGSLAADGENTTNLLLQETAAAILAERENLSSDGAAALESYEEMLALVPGGLYKEEWNPNLGGHNINVDLPGSAFVASPPVARLSWGANQKMVGNLWEGQYQLADAGIRSEWSGKWKYVGPPKWFVWEPGQKVDVYLRIMGQMIKSDSVLLPCSHTQASKLYEGSLVIANKGATVSVFGVVSVDLSMQATGHAKLAYSYTHNVCDANNASITGVITPEVRVALVASASTNLLAARGSATLNADVFNTSMPATVSATYQNSSAVPSSLTACTTVKGYSQAINGLITGRAEMRFWKPFKFFWLTVASGVLWSFETPATNHEYLNKCLQ